LYLIVLVAYIIIDADAGLLLNQQAQISERLTDQNIDQYVLSILLLTTWADENVITASSLLYNVTICIFRSGEEVPSTCIGSEKRCQYSQSKYVSIQARAVEEMSNHDERCSRIGMLR